MCVLTVITTTFNRDYSLPQVYQSLCRQTSKDFIWLIIDDGSTDTTLELVKNWQGEKKINIEYFWKENGGMHTARNLGYEKVHTEINTMIDSDDWMPDDAVEKIISFWKKNKRKDIAGIIGLDASKEGKVIGNHPPRGLKECHFSEFFGKYKGRGDKKLVYRSDLTRLYPYPEFPGEKFYPASYKFLMLDTKYKMLVMDDVLCIADYNSDSMTYAKFAQYKSCAKGFAHFRNETAAISKSFSYICKQYIHYWAEVRFAGSQQNFLKAKRKFWAFLMWWPGLLYYHYLVRTSRKY